MDNPYQAPSSEGPPPLPVEGVEGLKNPRLLGVLAVSFYALSTLGEVAHHLQRSYAAGVAMAELHAHDTYYVVSEELGPMEWLALASALPAAIFYLMWKYRVAGNAWILKPAVMRTTPTMAVVSYFIPLLNLVRPCQAMAGIAKASYGSNEGVALWWITLVISWIGGAGIGITLIGQDPHAPPTVLEHLYLAWSIATFVAGWRIVMGISKAQAERCVK